jgi:Ti-type conjugative transfer relaxase TraA
VAEFSLSMQVVGRSHRLKNAVAAAAYRAGERLYDEKLMLIHDFSKKAVELSEILAPEGAPAWMLDRTKLWNACEASANHTRAVTAREMRIALPRELTRAQQIEVARSFLQEEFVARGMVVDWSLHDEADKNQPHVHVMLTMREIQADGFGNKVRAWNDKKLLFGWREGWALHANRALERAGHEERVDHRSYKDRGIDLAPQPKLYRHPDDSRADGRAEVQRRLEAFRKTARENGERILRDPTIPLRMLTQQRATFRRDDLLKVLHTHTLDAVQFEACRVAVMASPELVELPTGRYTTQEMLGAERRLVAAADALSGSRSHEVSEARVQAAVARANARLAQGARGQADTPMLSDEQRVAIEHLTRSSGSIALLEGHAGTGKSFLLGAAREAWEAEGFTVIGGALAGKAAEGLELSSGIEARTLASWERAWELGRTQLTAKHVLVIDEAGMLGTRQLGRVVEEARARGAKVVLVGDSRQLQAIEAGSPFRVLGERLGAQELTEVRRQRVDWQREATTALRDRPAEGLEAYHAHGLVRASLTTDKARAALVKAWAEGLQTTPIAEQQIYAYRRDDVRALNELARAVRVQAGELGEGVTVATENGARVFAPGDRVYFGKNDRDLNVKNGTVGTVEQIDARVMVVRLDGTAARRVSVPLDAYQHLDHGYAMTVHKSQGSTVDRVYVMASKLFDASVTYPAMSRHRDHVELHWARDEFGTRAQLDQVLCRERPKELALEQLDARATTLKEALADDSRFALLAPKAQRALLQQYEKAYDKLRTDEPVLTPEMGLQQHPAWLAAWKRADDATKKLVQATDALGAYQAQKAKLRWYETMKDPEQPLVRAAEQAERAMRDAKRELEKVEQDPALREELKRTCSARNTRIDRHGQRLQHWRSELLNVERAGVCEHALERYARTEKAPVRMAIEADRGTVFKLVRQTEKGVALSDGSTMHFALLKAPDGTRVAKPLEAHERHGLRIGQSLRLESTVHGRLELKQGRSLDRGRGR